MPSRRHVTAAVADWPARRGVREATPWYEQGTTRRTAQSRWRLAVLIATVLYTMMVAAIVWIDWLVSEQSWFGSALAFVPRQPFAAGAIALTLSSAFISKRLMAFNAVVAAFTAFSVMHYSVPPEAAPAAATGQRIQLVTCNVQGFQGSRVTLIAEAMRFDPDVLVFQETRAEPKALRKAIPDWDIVWVDEFWVASRFPVTLIEEGGSVGFDRSVGITVQIDAPDQSFRLTNLHLMTPRFGLQELSLGSVLDGSGPDAMESHTRLRAAEAAAASTFTADTGAGYPQIICGDFNMPEFSSIYRHNFSQYQNSFSQTNHGYGYTTPCNTRRLWPNNLPWVRIDHVLATNDWTVQSCRIGETNGSDHRMVACTLQMNSKLELSEIQQRQTPHQYLAEGSRQDSVSPMAPLDRD